MAWPVLTPILALKINPALKRVRYLLINEKLDMIDIRKRPSDPINYVLSDILAENNGHG